MRFKPVAAPPSLHQYQHSDCMQYHSQEYQQLPPEQWPGALQYHKGNGKANNQSMSRPLEELLTSSGILTGQEAHRLREYCNSAYLDFDADLTDSYGVLFEDGDLNAFHEHFEGRVKHFEGKRYEAAQELFKLRWGAMRTPVYVVLLTLRDLHPPVRQKYIAIAEWLVNTAKVPVDGMF